MRKQCIGEARLCRTNESKHYSFESIRCSACWGRHRRRKISTPPEGSGGCDQVSLAIFSWHKIVKERINRLSGAQANDEEGISRLEPQSNYKKKI